MRRILSIALCIMMVFTILASCAEVEQTPSESSAPEPTSPTESLADRVEHIHKWIEADYDNPKICETCGETDGEPLVHNHVLKEANYQEPQICTECGDTEGLPLPAGFEESGYTINMTVGESYPYKTITWEDHSVNTIGEVSFTDFRVFDSEEGREAKDGYEYQAVIMHLTYADDNAYRGGTATRAFDTDYYLFDASRISSGNIEDLPESDIPGLRVRDEPVNFYGIDYEHYISVEAIQSEWLGRTYVLVLEIVFLGPVGYDGYMWVLYNGANNPEGGSQRLADNLDADSLIIRFRG